VRAGAAGVDDALGDALVVESVDLFARDLVFEQRGTWSAAAVTDSEPV
jgi:hypothetical protein